MTINGSYTAINQIISCNSALTPKERIIGDYILNNPRKAVFMTTNELSQTCKVSKATVVRFVKQLGYEGYGAFLQALRDYVDTDLTLLDRADISALKGAQTDRLRRVISEEIDKRTENTAESISFTFMWELDK